MRKVEAKETVFEEGAEVARWMGLDVGKRRIGIALSDPLGITAQAYEVWTRRGLEADVAHMRQLWDEQDVRVIVLGRPLRTDGSEGPEVAYVEEFAQALARAIPEATIEWIDERFTTQAAERDLAMQGLDGRKRRQVVDMAAAALILQTYMERRRND